MASGAASPVRPAAPKNWRLMSCTWGDCERRQINKKAGLCAAHYQRQRDGRDMDAPLRRVRQSRLSSGCEYPGCTRPHACAGYCTAHYQRKRRGDDMDAPLDPEPRTCSHPGCERPHSAKGYCSAHYSRKFVLHSDMDAPFRAHRRKDEPPRLCSWGGCDELWDGTSSGLCPRHENRRKNDRQMDGPAYYRETEGWITKQGYRKLRRNGKAVFEHRVVMEEILGRPLLKAEEVHHKNGIKSDNTPSNLELWVSWKGQRVEDLVSFVATNYRDRLLAELAAQQAGG